MTKCPSVVLFDTQTFIASHEVLSLSVSHDNHGVRPSLELDDYRAWSIRRTGWGSQAVRSRNVCLFPVLFVENVDRELGALLLHIYRMILQSLLSFHTAACSTGVNIVLVFQLLLLVFSNEKTCSLTRFS